jgi:hypothetical protein
MRALCLGCAGAVAACAPQMASTVDSPMEQAPVQRAATFEPRIVPIPEIPVGLRGCWVAIPPEDPEEPHGDHRLIVTATTIELIAENSPGEVATAEYVTRVTPTSIEGLFSSPDQHGRATLATSLSRGEYGPADDLRRAEGDAGSVFYSRCTQS